MINHPQPDHHGNAGDDPSGIADHRNTKKGYNAIQEKHHAYLG
jgi:hypothetical protein